MAVPSYAWMTDVHLNFINDLELAALVKRVQLSGVDGLLLGGDIAEALSIERYLRELASGLDMPIYFVLGNHDYYKGTIAEVRAGIRTLCAQVDNLHWLPGSGGVELSANTALFGHGGWGDGRFGDFLGSTIRLNDYLLIGELAGLDNERRLRQLHQLGDEAAAHVRATLPALARRYDRLVFLTHVPPFRETCLYDGKISDDNWLPHFSCKAVGVALHEVMATHPDCHLTVLCGHTHGSGNTSVLPNLYVRTGGAEYGAPEIQRPLLMVA